MYNHHNRVIPNVMEPFLPLTKSLKPKGQIFDKSQTPRIIIFKVPTKIALNETLKINTKELKFNNHG